MHDRIVCLNDPVNWIDALGLYVKHWGEDKLPPWLRDKRTNSEREAKHQKYNKNIKDRLDKSYPIIYWFDPPTWPFHLYEHYHKKEDINDSKDDKDNPCR